MRPRFAAALVAASLAALTACNETKEPAAPAVANAFPSDEALKKILETRIVDEKRLHGVVLGVIDADGRRRVVMLGDPGAGVKPLSGDSVYEIGSITKAFTGVLLAEMDARGEVDMTAPAQACAPDGLTLPARNGQEITLELLSNQRSGLPRLPSNLQPADMTNPYADYTAKQLHAFLNTHELTRDPGEAYEYSNVGVGLLGYLLANCAGKDYETLVRERILDPLGMEMTGIMMSPAMTANLVTGHNAAGSAVPNWDNPTLASSGALRSSVNDMLGFLDANMGEPVNDLEKAMRESHRARDFSAGPKVGLGWHIEEVNGHSIVSHNGGTGGYRTFAGFDPVRNIGVVILNNSEGPPDDIAMHLLAGAPLTPPPAPPVARQEIPLAPEALETFVGDYTLEAAPNFHLVFTVENGVLTLTPSGQGSDPLFPESPVKFFSKAVDAQIEFTDIQNGKAGALILHQGGQHKATRME